MSLRTSSFAAVTTGIILALGLTGSAYLLSKFMVKIQKENTISVKGVAEREVRSDLGSLNASFSLDNSSRATGYKQISQLGDKIMALLKQQGLNPDEVELGNLTTAKMEKTIKVDGKEQSVFSHFRFSQNVTLTTTRLELLKKVADALNALQAENIDISVYAPQYYLSDPEQFKQELISQATDSAVKRARAIAEQCGGKVGNIISARQGVIQITRPASDNSSDSGYYDTFSVEKMIRIVVSLEVEIK